MLYPERVHDADGTARRSPIQNVQFWGGLIGLMVTLSIGAQLWTQSTPWRVIDYDFGAVGIFAVRIDPDENAQGAGPPTQADWLEEVKRQHGTRLDISSVVVGVIGIGLTATGAIGAPVWVASRGRLDRLADKPRTRWLIACWAGVPVLLCLWLLSNLFAVIT